ncbi:4-(cytidine 5'-diphospho)-2-C-methyl-D-erythritol kinase [Thiohalobacter sp.]|uniref:4-(cytidine 5'-diphospho)-2-C-methyl-D-erythritol kinase n=1 Tax=Thiohalobacter sp. TaxID=2025948 RepID=UPI0026321080|nr:4-(cytidine 5'-diphospho)-2-C-methyl-D-erythritol kinase [Thiohalobacter sp.]
MRARPPERLSVPAPAKINLFLHVLGRRADGYHLLQTAFQFLDYADLLHFRRRDDACLRRLDEVPGVDPGTDLVLRAARALQRHAGVRLGVDIALDKRLPLGGGLGGGSSDAATTLLALNRLWGLDLPMEVLARIGLELGADVPVFVHGRAAWAEGVGERLTPIEPPEPWYLVAWPPLSVSTAAVFSDPELTRNTPPIKISAFRPGVGRNDCEALVRRRFPEVGQLIDWMAERAPARMSGTGACVFAAFAGEAAARAALAELPAPWQGFVARGCNRSPAHEVLASP